MKKNLPVCILVLLILASACKKDKFITEPNSQVMIGNYSNMRLITYDKTIQGFYHQPSAVFEIDLDNDFMPDIQFSCTTDGSPGLGMLSSSRINCLNPAVQLYGHIQGDTLFKNTVATDTIFNADSIHVEIRYSRYYSCGRRAATDSIYIQPDKFVLIPLYKDSILMKEKLFKSDKIELITPSYGYPSYVTQQGDTTKAVYTQFYYACDNFPVDKLTYIGIKMTVNNIEKIGWLKILISSPGSKMTIVESAIQE